MEKHIKVKMSPLVPTRRDRHQHPTHFVYQLEINAKQGWKRWLKVAVCDQCSHKVYSGATYDEPPKELIWKEENGEIKPQAEAKDGTEDADTSGEEVQSPSI